MNVKSVEKQEKSQVELIIEVSGEEFEAAIDKVYKKQRGKIAVPGFRKGHAPPQDHRGHVRLRRVLRRCHQ